MSRSSDGRGRPRWAATAGACVVAAAAAGRVGAQTPQPTRPAPTDSARRDALRDTLRAPSDSTQRDSVVERQLRRVSAEREPLYRRIAPDRLRLSAVGVSAGLAVPNQARAVPMYAVHADYGELLPSVRAVVGVTYWSSRYRDGVVSDFARAVRGVVTDPAGDDTVRVGRIRTSDVAITVDLRLRPPARRIGLPGALRPWAGVGGGVHLLDVEGAPVSGTFVERALDGVAFGVALSAGTDLVLSQSARLTGQARYDLFNGAHFASLRAGASYVFDRRGGA